MNYSFQLCTKLTELTTLRNRFEDIFEKELLFDDLTRKNILLALTELFVNVFKHGNVSEMSEINYEIQRSGNGLDITISDWGNSYDPFSLLPPDISQLPENGYGVFLVKSLMASFEYQPKTMELPNITRISKQVEL